MDNTQEKQRQFQQALSALLESLPENHRVNTALFLKNNQSSTFSELVSFLACKCQMSISDVHRHLPDESESMQTVEFFLKNEQPTVQQIASLELQLVNDILTSRKD